MLELGSGTGRVAFAIAREGIDVGPYESQLEADIEAETLRELIRHANVQGEALAVLKDFILESFTMGRPLNVMLSEEEGWELWWHSQHLVFDKGRLVSLSADFTNNGADRGNDAATVLASAGELLTAASK